MATKFIDNVKLRSVNEYLQPNSTQKDILMDVDISQLHAFDNHPFLVLEDDKMEETMRSIKAHGVLVPILIRKKQGLDGYEILSGHRRKRACELLGIKTIPAFLRELSDEESIIVMVDSNIQREDILYQERAFAYKMKHSAVLALKSKNLLSQDQQNITKLVAEYFGESISTVKRYISLTNLYNPLLKSLDDGVLTMKAAYELSLISLDLQKVIYQRILAYEIFPNVVQASKLKNEASGKQELEESIIDSILTDKKYYKQFTVDYNKLKSYFPQDYSMKQIREELFKILEEYNS